MARSTVCLGCAAATTNGSRCERCAGGRRAPRRNPRSDPRYIKAAARLVEEHRRQHGPICPHCGGRERPGDFGSRLSADHVTPLSEGGDLLGPMRVLCVSCNARRNVQRNPHLARRGR